MFISSCFLYYTWSILTCVSIAFSYSNVSVGANNFELFARRSYFYVGGDYVQVREYAVRRLLHTG